MRGSASATKQSPTMALSIRILVALQRPSRTIDKIVKQLNKIQPENMRAVSSVNFHGAREIKMEGWMNTITEPNTPSKLITFNIHLIMGVKRKS